MKGDRDASTGRHYACTLAQTVSWRAPRDKAMASLQRECWPLVALYLGVFDWKIYRFCWPKGTSLECAESISVKITEAACVCDEFMPFKREEGWANVLCQNGCTNVLCQNGKS